MFVEFARNNANNIFEDIGETTPTLNTELKIRQNRERGHAEDVANWILVLSPNASFELLMAGWLHDCERLLDFDGTVGYKGDRGSAAYQEHKRDHAKRSAELAQAMLEKLDVPQESIDRVHHLILHHDDTGEEINQLGDEDLTVLAAADSFSFFTYIAPDMLAREGGARLQTKADFMVSKMSPSIRQLLTTVQLTDETISRVKEQALINVGN